MDGINRCLSYQNITHTISINNLIILRRKVLLDQSSGESRIWVRNYRILIIRLNNQFHLIVDFIFVMFNQTLYVFVLRNLIMEPQSSVKLLSSKL